MQIGHTCLRLTHREREREMGTTLLLLSGAQSLQLPLPQMEKSCLSLQAFTLQAQIVHSGNVSILTVLTDCGAVADLSDQVTALQLSLSLCPLQFPHKISTIYRGPIGTGINPTLHRIYQPSHQRHAPREHNSLRHCHSQEAAHPRPPLDATSQSTDIMAKQRNH